MHFPTIAGRIARRILITYRVDPEVAERFVPPPFTPQIVNGYAVAGICLIRLEAVRPRGWPAQFGFSSENAAHRFAVTWGEGEDYNRGVYIPRRDTSSRFNAAVGGRTFPGVHHHARFEVDESDRRYRVALASDDSAVKIAVDAAPCQQWQSAVFPTLDDASEFYRCGACGYSPTRRPRQYEGLGLRCDRWEVTPLAVSELRSSFFDDEESFPTGTATFDHALLMRDIPHEWAGLGALAASSAQQVAVAI